MFQRTLIYLHITCTLSIICTQFSMTPYGSLSRHKKPLESFLGAFFLLTLATHSELNLLTLAILGGTAFNRLACLPIARTFPYSGFLDKQDTLLRPIHPA